MNDPAFGKLKVAAANFAQCHDRVAATVSSVARRWFQEDLELAEKQLADAAIVYAKSKEAK